MTWCFTDGLPFLPQKPKVITHTRIRIMNSPWRKHKNCITFSDNKMFYDANGETMLSTGRDKIKLGFGIVVFGLPLNSSDSSIAEWLRIDDGRDLMVEPSLSHACGHSRNVIHSEMNSPLEWTTTPSRRLCNETNHYLLFSSCLQMHEIFVLFFFFFFSIFISHFFLLRPLSRFVLFRKRRKSSEKMPRIQKQATTMASVVDQRQNENAAFFLFIFHFMIAFLYFSE